MPTQGKAPVIHRSPFALFRHAHLPHEASRETDVIDMLALAGTFAFLQKQPAQVRENQALEKCLCFVHRNKSRIPSVLLAVFPDFGKEKRPSNEFRHPDLLQTAHSLQCCITR